MRRLVSHIASGGLFTGLVLSTTGCVVYGPKAEYKSPLNVLNGENYDTSADTGRPGGLLVPVIKTKERLTTIRGAVFAREGISDLPLKRASVELRSSSGELIATVLSDLNGNYVFTREIKNGSYTVRATVGEKSAVRNIRVDSYLVDRVDLLVASESR